jgi:chemotaxis protein methyltransferase CheR
MMAGNLSGGSRSFGSSTTIFAFTDAAFGLLSDLIVRRTGVLFDDSKRGLLADKLSELVAANGLTSFLDYYYLLRYDERAESHWAALMDRLAVPETYFWRQVEQIEALANIVAPAHFAAYPGRPLRIWSAGCCSGEEPISLAMALAENGLLGEQPIEINATDGSSAMIDRARRGSYGERSFRQLPAALKAKYFEQESPERWRPVDALGRAIRWGVVNLARADEVRRLASCDVIFCRNVFIYFSDEAIRSTVRVFSEFMPADGYLFLGAAESLTRLGLDLELAEIGSGFAYVRLGRRAVLEQARARAPHPGARRGPVLTSNEGQE